VQAMAAIAFDNQKFQRSCPFLSVQWKRIARSCGRAFLRLRAQAVTNKTDRQRPTARYPAYDRPYTLPACEQRLAPQNAHLRAHGFGALVELDEASAIAKPVEQFTITNPAHQTRLMRRGGVRSPALFPRRFIAIFEVKITETSS
jgi:hypothetical protein